MTLIEMIGATLTHAGFFRILASLLLFPVPDGLLGLGARLGMALVLASANIDIEILPASASSISQISGEFVLGLFLGVPLLILYHGLRMLGDLFESLRGHQIGLIIDPLSGGEEQPLAILLSHTVLYLLVAGTLAPLLFAECIQSLERFPPETVNSLLIAEYTKLVLHSSLSILSALMRLLLPFALVVLVLEFSLAIISRLASGLALASEAYSLRLLAALLFLVFQSDYLLSSSVQLLASSGP